MYFSRSMFDTYILACFLVLPGRPTAKYDIFETVAASEVSKRALETDMIESIIKFKLKSSFDLCGNKSIWASALFLDKYYEQIGAGNP